MLLKVQFKMLFAVTNLTSLWHLVEESLELSRVVAIVVVALIQRSWLWLCFLILFFPTQIESQLGYAFSVFTFNSSSTQFMNFWLSVSPTASFWIHSLAYACPSGCADTYLHFAIIIFPHFSLVSHVLSIFHVMQLWSVWEGIGFWPCIVFTFCDWFRIWFLFNSHIIFIFVTY